MNKKDVIKVIQEIAKEYELVVPKKMELVEGRELYTIGDLTQDDVDTLLKIFEDTFVALGEKLEIGESANVGVVKVTKKKVKERSGVSKLSEDEVEWTIPAKEKIVLAAKASFIKENEKEL